MMRSIAMKNAILSLHVIVFVLVFIPAMSFAGSWNGWIYQDPYPTSVNLFDVKFVTPMKGWITGKYGIILYTEDGGENWEAQESGTEEDIMRVCFVNEKMGWAAGERGTIIHTADGGKKWTTQYDIKALPTKIFFINEKEGWIAGSNPIGVIYHTADSGKTWKKLETDIQRAIGSIYFHNSQIGWILAGEDVYRTTDGGKKWEKNRLPLSSSAVSLLSPMRRGPGRSMNEVLGYDWWSGDIVFTSEKNGWAVIFVFLFHTGDGGKTWELQLDSGKMEQEFRHISFRDGKNGCASGTTVYCTEDGGKLWHERLGVKPGDSSALGGICLAGKSGGWVVGNAGQMLKTADNGRNWKTASTTRECKGQPYFINTKTGWFYEPRGFNLLCRTDDGGHTWEKQKIGMTVWNVFFVDGSTGWAVGLIEKWKDGKVSNALYNRTNAWAVIKNTIDGGKTWNTQYKESIDKEAPYGLFGINFIDRSRGWTVGIEGTILYTEDGGKHWVNQKSGDVKNSFSNVYFVNSKIGWITGYQYNKQWTGIILHTEDGGNLWKIQRKERDIAFDDLFFTVNNAGWIGGESEDGEFGVVLHTLDGGKTWSEKSFNNIGSNHIAFLDNDRGVVCSLRTGLMVITTDGGKTWSKRRVPLKKFPWHFSEIFENVEK